MLETADFDLDRLDVQARVCVYVALAVGSLVSHDAVILGEGPCTTSFKAMETLAGELKDLRPFGRRRRAAFETMRDHALKMAREADVLLEPSKLNAMSCVLLDYLTGTSASPFFCTRSSTLPRPLPPFPPALTPSLPLAGDVVPPNRPFLGGFMSHVRVLCDSGELDSDDALKTVWALGLSHDMLTEVRPLFLSSLCARTWARNLADVLRLAFSLAALADRLGPAHLVRPLRPSPSLHAPPDAQSSLAEPLPTSSLSSARSTSISRRSRPSFAAGCPSLNCTTSCAHLSDLVRPLSMCSARPFTTAADSVPLQSPSLTSRSVESSPRRSCRVRRSLSSFFIHMGFSHAVQSF